MQLLPDHADSAIRLCCVGCASRARANPTAYIAAAQVDGVADIGP